MSLNMMINNLQKINEGKIVIIKIGAFYIAKGRDAVLLNKLRKIEKSRYIDRIVHRWYVDNFLKPFFAIQFIYHSYACIKNKGMHKAVLDLQKSMKHCKNIWENYYILKMDIMK